MSTFKQLISGKTEKINLQHLTITASYAYC